MTDDDSGDMSHISARISTEDKNSLIDMHGNISEGVRVAASREVARGEGKPLDEQQVNELLGEIGELREQMADDEEMVFELLRARFEQRRQKLDELEHRIKQAGDGDAEDMMDFDIPRQLQSKTSIEEVSVSRRRVEEIWRDSSELGGVGSLQSFDPSNEAVKNHAAHYGIEPIELATVLHHFSEMRSDQRKEKVVADQNR